VAQTRARSVYMCGACGQQAPRWLGRCPSCGEWGTVAEQAPAAGRRAALGPAADAPRLADLVDAAPVRPVGHAVRRLAAAAGHGIEAAIMPPGRTGADPGSPAPPVIRAVPGVQEALDAAFAR
jgi:DNA repair protein RadA/Sms